MTIRYYLLCAVLLLTACGYKGDLYLPKESDPNHFDAIQTGIEFTQPIPNVVKSVDKDSQP